ncbi:MAG: hypothetical protein GPJ50_07360 [Candidatus Heimdallarchaeota archaeon]|nr:hypothetical protein [Candidatus Heimdallarchaeota archaeon]
MNKRKIFKIFLIVSFFALIIGGQKSSAIMYVGAIAEDGTRMFFTYFNPFAQYQDEYGKFRYNGTDQFIVENTVVIYQDVSIYISVNETKTVDYNITYFSMILNETTGFYDYEQYDYERRIVECSVYDFVTIDEFELPVHLDMVYIEITYLDLRFGFFHKTFTGVIVEPYTEYDLRIQALKTTLIVFSCVSIGAAVVAYGLVKKAGNFDIDWHWAFMIPLIIVNFFMIYATYIYYVSLKEMLYRFPFWVVVFIMFIMTAILLTNLFNRIKGRNYIRCDKFNTQAMTIETHMIPVDMNEKYYQEGGFKASCIRLFSLKKYDNSFNFGRFEEVEIEELVTVDDNEDKINKKADKLAGKGFILKSQTKAIEEGKKTLTFIKKQTVFEKTEVTPRWFWSPKGEASYLKAYMVKYIERENATIEIKSLWWIPSGVLCIFNLIWSFINVDMSSTLDAALKVTLWIIFGIVLLLTVGFHSIAGNYKIEVLDPHIALGIIAANTHLLTAEKDAETIADLKSRIQKLKTTKYIDSLEEGEKQTIETIDAIMNFLEHGVKPNLEEVR